jgi:putative zinc finger/helix-turn-helix YgiT family protein
MQNEVIALPNSESRICDSCGAEASRMNFENQHFKFGEGEHSVDLQARVPVWTCDACGDQYTDEAAEEIRHAVVCEHLGRLTPKQIVEIRNSYGLTQAEWSDLTGFGTASIKRWETGALIQSASADNLIRLLKEARNIEILQRARGRARTELVSSKFRTTIPVATTEIAHFFRLRRPSSIVQRT